MTTIHQQKVTPPSYFLFGAQTTSVDFAGPANVYVCSTARLTQYNTSHWRGGAIGRGVEMIKHNSERYTIKKNKKMKLIVNVSYFLVLYSIAYYYYTFSFPKKSVLSRFWPDNL